MALQATREEAVDPRVRSALLATTHILCPLMVGASTRSSIEYFVKWRASLASILLRLQATLPPPLPVI